MEDISGVYEIYGDFKAPSLGSSSSAYRRKWATLRNQPGPNHHPRPSTESKAFKICESNPPRPRKRLVIGQLFIVLHNHQLVVIHQLAYCYLCLVQLFFQ